MAKAKGKTKVKKDKAVPAPSAVAIVSAMPPAADDDDVEMEGDDKDNVPNGAGAIQERQRPMVVLDDASVTIHYALRNVPEKIVGVIEEAKMVMLAFLLSRK
eukprot:7109841-Pyramimonas_sp.AAC.1